VPTTKPSLPPFSLREHPHLMEIPAWAWLEELSLREGRKVTLGRVPDAEWDRLKELGFDMIWLMGVWRRSLRARHVFRSHPKRFAEYDDALPGWRLADIVGSPYAVEDYRPDPRIGTWRELDSVRRKLRERGMGLILDFVPNHTALDHPWVHQHPEYYIEGGEADFRKNSALFSLIEEKKGNLRFLAHGRDPCFPPWPDSAQLNLFNEDVRKALAGVVRLLARHADGLRCDMAMLALNDVFAATWKAVVPPVAPAGEFWSEIIDAAPELVWLAEAYWGMEGQLQDLGFQFTYDKPFCDYLWAGSAAELRRYLGGDFSRQQRAARFLENHDEQRAAAIFGPARMQAAATLAATAPGMRFYLHGQIDGRKIHQPVEMARAADEPVDQAVRALYERLLQLSNEDVFHSGRWRLLEAMPAGDGSNGNLTVYEWRLDGAWRLVAANPSGDAAQGRLALGSAVDPGAAYVLDDRLNGIEYARAGSELAGGLFIRLEPGRAHVFEIRRAS
jgi:glycosidase